MRAALLLGSLVLAGFTVLTVLQRDFGSARDVAEDSRLLTAQERRPELQAPPAAVAALREILRADATAVAQSDELADRPAVRGRVVDGHGRPARAAVALVDSVAPFTVLSAAGQAASTFELRPEDAGRYWVLARGAEGITRAWLDLDPRRPEAQELVLQLEGRGRLRGTLTDADGRPLADWPLAFRLAGSEHTDDPLLELDVSVSEDDFDGPGRTWAFARTNPTGGFEARGLRPGVWSIRTSRVADAWRGEHVLAHAVPAQGRPLPLVLPVHRLRVGLVDERFEALPFQPARASELTGLRLWRVEAEGWRRVFTGWRPTGQAHVWETYLEPDVLHAVTFGTETRPLVHSDPIAAAERGTSEVEVRAAPDDLAARVRVRLPADLDDGERELVVVTLEDARHGVPVAVDFFAVSANGGELVLGPLPPGVYDLTVGGVTRIWPEWRDEVDPEVVAPSRWSTRLVAPPGSVGSFLADVEPRGELRVLAEPGEAHLEELATGLERTPRRSGPLWVFGDLRPGAWRLRVRFPDGTSIERTLEVLRSRVTTARVAR